MEIPESIQKITSEVTADPFNVSKKIDNVSIDQIVHEIKRGLEFKDLQHFEQGISFYKKDMTSEKNFIKNFIALFSDHLVRSIRISSISDTKKDEVIVATTQMLKGIEQQLDTNYSLLNMLNNEQNLLDARSLLMIILGYAIGNIKRIHNP